MVVRKLWTIILTITTVSANGQLIVSPQLPPSGIVSKNQLWNIVVTNPGNSNLSGTISMMMTNSVTGEQILGASTAAIVYMPGNNVITANSAAPIQYNVLSANYYVDQGPTGFLPAGSFMICYTFNSDSVSHLPFAEACSEIDILPLSPPQLVFPENGTALDTTALPSFTWLPPAPTNIFNPLQYDFNLVQINPGQAASDAIESNIPLAYQHGLQTASLLYPSSAPSLQQGVKYAWRVTAKNGEMPVMPSETWVFTLKGYGADSTGLGELPYTRLKKDNQSGYSICAGNLKFAYINETADSSWNVSVFDISATAMVPIKLGMDSVPLKKGLNLTKLNISNNSSFIDQHIYLFELTNSRNEVWRMKFEYLSPIK